MMNNQAFRNYLASGLVCQSLWPGIEEKAPLNMWVGLVSVNTIAEPGTIYRITSAQQAVETFGTEGDMANLATLALQNGAPVVACVAIEYKDTSSYSTSFDMLCGEPDIAILICDSYSVPVQQAMCLAIGSSIANRHDRVGIAGGLYNEYVETAIIRTNAMRSRNMVVVYMPSGVSINGLNLHGYYPAACISGVLARNQLSKKSIIGLTLTGVQATNAMNVSEGERNYLLDNGVSILQCNDSDISISFIQDTVIDDGIYV